MTDAEREERRQTLKGYACLLREARAHAMGAQSKKPSKELGEAINIMGTLESAAMLELHKMGLPKPGTAPLFEKEKPL